MFTKSLLKKIINYVYFELRFMNFLNKDRCDAYLRIYVFVFFAIFSIAYFMGRKNLQADFKIGGDFILFWAASSQILHGHFSDIYNTAAHEAAMQHGQFLDHSYKLPFLYPPPMLFFTWPIAFFTYSFSYTLWALSAPIITAKTLNLLCKNWSITAFAFFSPQFIVSLLTGQNGLLIALILAIGLFYLTKKPFLSGLILGLLVIKPHVVFLVPLCLIFSRKWRIVAGIVTSASFLIIASYCVFGFETWKRFFEYSHVMQNSILHNVYLCQLFITIFGFLSVHGLSFIMAFWIQIIFSLLIIACVLYNTFKSKNIYNNIVLSLSASPLCTPYLLYYDLTYMLIPAIWIINTTSRTGFFSWEKPFLIILYFSPLYTLTLTWHYHFPAEPIVATLFFCLILRRHRYLKKTREMHSKNNDI
ncbi:glycosyltransferase family 87 protein [Acetobacter fabarum]|uniref:glycosyltransferase family 87 protein n=1 Tax=Acetobacter fabarum TaxID=483199 RepID=UPI00312B774C